MDEIGSLLEQLRDIEGLDSISAWPLAIGWWVILGLGIFILSVLACYFIRQFKFRRSWKYDSLKKLDVLLDGLSQVKITESMIQSSVILFSEYLRRIALHRFSRKTCAGLTGKVWLEWLSKHDLKAFDWSLSGKILIQAPYAPSNVQCNSKSSQEKVEELKILILAAKEWVR